MPYHDNEMTMVDETNESTNKPVGFELNSIMHMCCAFGSHIYSISSMTTYVFFVWQTYIFGCCTHVYNANEVLSFIVSNILHL